MNNKLSGKSNYMALKLDIKKAYDRVQLAFFRAVMRKINFAHQWIELVMKGVESISYSNLINGIPTISQTISRD